MRHRPGARAPRRHRPAGGTPTTVTPGPCPHLVLGLLLQAPPLVQGLGGGAPGPRPSARLILRRLGHQLAGLVVVLTALPVTLLGLAKVGLCLLLRGRGDRLHGDEETGSELPSPEARHPLDCACLPTPAARHRVGHLQHPRLWCRGLMARSGRQAPT